jgi:hypothetical protein
VPDIGSLSGSASAIFGAKPGDIVGPVQGGRNAVVMSLLDKQEPTPEEIQKGTETARQQLIQRKRDEVLEVYITNLVARMEKDGKIKRNKKAIERLSKTEGLGGGGGEPQGDY